MWGRGLDQFKNFSFECATAFFNKNKWTSNDKGKGYKFFAEQYVTMVRTKDMEISAICYRSQKKNSKPHQMSMVFEDDAGSLSLIDAHCSCEAGNSGSCSHVVGLAYTLQNYILMGFDEMPLDEASKSCTDLPMRWNIPRGKKIEPTNVPAIHFHNPLNKNRKRAPITSTLIDPRMSPEKKIRKDVVIKLKQNMTSVSGKIPAGYLLTANVDNFLCTAEGICVPEGSFLGNQVTKMVKNKRKLNICLPVWDGEATNILLSLPPVYTEACQNVSFETSAQLQKATMTQAATTLWHSERQKRFTASNFKKICRRQLLSKEFLDTLHKDISFVRAVSHGKSTEAEAKEKYLLSKQNKVDVFETGLVVHPFASHLGASPDGIIFDPLAGYGVLEVKCPYSKKFSSITEGCKVKNFCLHLDENNRPSLKQNHEYYFQVQGQMLLTGLTWCDFVLYFKDSGEVHVERIMFNAQFAMDMYVTLTHKYVQVQSL